MIDEAVATYVGAATEDFPEEWDLEALWTALSTLYPISLRHQDLEARPAGATGSTATTCSRTSRPTRRRPTRPARRTSARR